MKASPTVFALFAVCCAPHAWTATCTPIHEEPLLARHLAAALPAFGAVPPDQVIGPAPVPGARRTMRTAELLSLQRKFGLPAEALPDVCFEWPLRTLVEEEVVAAIRAALDNPQAAVDVVEISAFPAPEGRIEFQKSQLLPQPADAARTAVLWRGDVVYGRGRRFSIWARVRLRVPCTRAVAMEALRPGQSIRSEQVRVEAGECFPTEVSASDQVAGMRVKRFIAAGAAVPHSALEPVYDVNRGDKVAVEVRCGAARLAFTAQAETGGAAGDEVTLRNPDSKRTFRAQVEGPGRAVVTIPTSGDN